MQRKHVAQHHVLEQPVVVAEQQIAHRHDAEQPLGRVDDIDVRDERALHQLAQVFDGFADALRWRERGHDRLHHPAHRVLRV
jgi:hypothetical protein